jgi:Ala-tRNA(Pro) deacylase
MPVRRVREFLDSLRVRYVTLRHSPAYTAQEIAAAAHVKGSELAKTVMVKIDGKIAMAVVPASRMVDFERLREVAGGEKADLASEREFRDSFPECEVGAMPPFGNLWGMETYVSEELARDPEIAFSAGTHTELIRLPFEDYKRLVQPRIAEFSVRA